MKCWRREGKEGGEMMDIRDPLKHRTFLKIRQGQPDNTAEAERASKKAVPGDKQRAKASP